VDVWPPSGTAPSNYWQTQQRINELLYADKTDYDQSACERVNRYVELVWELDRLAQNETLPESSEVRRRIAQEYAGCRDEGFVSIDVTTIQREALTDEDVSHEIDFSPRRIVRLIEQGDHDATPAATAIARQRIGAPDTTSASGQRRQAHKVRRERV
jgi:hypothetical protein